MTLHPTMRRRIHERLHPLIGDEESDALLDEVSGPEPVTREWLETRFDRIDDRFQQIDDRFIQFEQRMSDRFERIDDKFREQMAWSVGGIGVIATVLTVAQIIWG